MQKQVRPRLYADNEVTPGLTGHRSGLNRPAQQVVQLAVTRSARPRPAEYRGTRPGRGEPQHDIAYRDEGLAGRTEETFVTADDRVSDRQITPFPAGDVRRRQFAVTVYPEAARELPPRSPRLVRPQATIGA